MALMECPNCGKKDVSETANVCPECGFSIEEHILNKKKEEDYLSFNRYKIEWPSKPRISSKWFIFILVVVLISCLFIMQEFIEADILDTAMTMLFLIIFAAGIAPFLVYYVGVYTPKYNEYKESTDNPVDYCKKKIAQKEGNYVKNMECPICHKYMVKKITTLNRAISVSMVGLASDKIGKQYQCMHCGHKW